MEESMGHIHKLSLVHFNTNDLSSFLSRALRLLNENLPEKDAGLVSEYQASLSTFKACLARKPEHFRESIIEADAQVDDAWTAINYLLKVGSMHYDSVIREASIEVSDIFNQYPNPTHMPFSDEYAILDKLLPQLEAIVPEKLHLSGIDGWLVVLRERIQAFHQLQTAKTESQASVVVGEISNARKKVVNDWQALLKRLDASITLFDDEAHKTVALQLNALIDEAKAISKAQKTARSKATVDRESNN